MYYASSLVTSLFFLIVSLGALFFGHQFFLAVGLFLFSILWLLYSVGPDGDDDKGIGEKWVRAEGDIAYRSIVQEN